MKKVEVVAARVKGMDSNVMNEEIIKAEHGSKFFTGDNIEYKYRLEQGPYLSGVIEANQGRVGLNYVARQGRFQRMNTMGKSQFMARFLAVCAELTDDDEVAKWSDLWGRLAGKAEDNSFPKAIFNDYSRMQAEVYPTIYSTLTR